MMWGMRFEADMTAETREAAWRHAVPFAAWVLIMSLPMADLAMRYALQAAVGAVVLWVAKPWRYYRFPAVRQLPWAVIVGVTVCALWILPESDWMKAFGRFQEFYGRYGMRHAGGTTRGSPFAPEQCGWALAVVRLLGSAVVIAVAEEFFWRGFLMRWLSGKDFLSTVPGAISGFALISSSVLFALEHDRWVMGFAAGVMYGWLYRRTGNLWIAIAAHMITNYLLGLYVLAWGAYRFW